MRRKYDFSEMESRPNPFTKLLKQRVTLRLDRSTVEYFKALSERTGLPYQHLINLYLRDCALRRKEPSMRWAAARRRATRAAARPAPRAKDRG